MDSRETKRTVPVPSVGADGEQPNSQICTTASISEAATEDNPQDESMEDILRELQRTSDLAYLHTVSMSELYQNVYQSRPPIIDGLFYQGFNSTIATRSAYGEYIVPPYFFSNSVIICCISCAEGRFEIGLPPHKNFR